MPPLDSQGIAGRARSKVFLTILDIELHLTLSADPSSAGRSLLAQQNQRINRERAVCRNPGS
jgi:hypothetical protein